MTTADDETKNPSPRRRSEWLPTAVVVIALIGGILWITTQFFGFPPPLGPGRVVDGFPVGPASICSASGGETWDCDAWKRMAGELLDHKEPGHPAILSHQLHSYDFHNAEFFPDGMPIWSGGHSVMVLRLIDGSERAMAVDCNPGGCGVSDDPPLRPGVEATLCHPDTTKWNQCETIISVARAFLADAEPGHPAIEGMTLDTKNDEGQYVVWFELLDGREPGVRVGCTPEACTATGLER